MFDASAPEGPLVGDIQIRPLRPTIGAEICGVDLTAALASSARERVRAAVLRHKVVFFHDQWLTSEQHIDFASQFGHPYAHPTTDHHAKTPMIQQIRPPNPARLAKIKAAAGPNQVSAGYHADTSWRLAPAWAGILRPIRLPSVGGDTIWVDAEQAFENLDDDLKQRLRAMHVTHDFRESLLTVGLDYPIVAHPVVHRHEKTGKEVLWVNFAARPRIIGYGEDESRDILTLVLRQYENPEHQIRFRWTPGAVAFWDNRSTVHLAVQDYGDFPRLLERVLLVEEPAYAAL